MKTVVFANQKGGVGKSTLTCLLAYFLAERQASRVRVIDLDAQCNTSRTLRAFAAGAGAIQLFEAAPVVWDQAPAGIALMAASSGLANLDIAAPWQANQRVHAFTTQIERWRGESGYCLIDPPPTLGIRMVAALAAADYVIAPIELETYSIEGVAAMIKVILGVRQQRNPRLKFLGILANRFTHNAVRQKTALHALFEHYGDFLLPFKISTRAAIPRALEEGVPVWRLTSSAAREAAGEVIPVFEALLARMNASDPAAVAS